LVEQRPNLRHLRDLAWGAGDITERRTSARAVIDDLRLFVFLGIPSGEDGSFIEAGTTVNFM
jgi:hypothetical protein